MTKLSLITLLGLGLLATACAHQTTAPPTGQSAGVAQVVTIAPHARHQDGPPAKSELHSAAKESR
jgi:hypothetical protein